ncbi:MAG: hypothetical protein KF800_05290 [Lysobacter sp.]|nr:hypothetical protein [Lysobacter sp.]
MDVLLSDLASFHDAELVQLRFLKEELCIEIEYLSPSKKSLVIRGSGVLAFRAIDIVTQNVVSRILLTGTHKLSDAHIREKLQWVSSCVDAPSYFSLITIDDYLMRIQRSEIFLLIIESSIGAEICLLCEKVRLSSIKSVI